jgi:hypothetical protein
MLNFDHERHHVVAGFALALALAGAGCGGADSGAPPSPPPGFPPPPPPAGVVATVTVDNLTRYQVMTGWEATADADIENPAFNQWRDQLVTLAVEDLGINRLRLPVRNGAEHPADNYTEYLAERLPYPQWRCQRYTTVNDNADPNVIAPSGFNFTELDARVEKLVLPFKQKLEARGEHLVVNLNYTAFLSQCNPLPPYPHSNPAEYAEFILAAFQHLQQKYGLVPDILEILLEPDNTGASSPWNGTLVGQAIAATGPRLAAAGFHPKFTAPSTMRMSSAVSYFDQMRQVPAVLPFVDEIAYHRYGGVSDANLTALADRARAFGLKTAMLEHIGSGVDDLYKDILLGRASAWQQHVLGYPIADNGGQYYIIANAQPVLASRTRYLRQYFRYIRLGAQRVEAGSTEAGVRPLAFVNANGKQVVVLQSDLAGPLFLRGIKPGTYGISVTTSSATGTEMGNQVVNATGALTINVPAASVLTVYQK